VSTPLVAVTRSTVVTPSDPGRVALALVLHRLALRHWADVLVPAALVLGLEWLLGLPLLVGLLLAVATAAVLVTLRIWQARRRFARTFPVGSRLTVTASPDGLVLTRGDDPPAFDVRWHLFDSATLVRDHLVLGLTGSQALVTLPASLSDEVLVAAVRAGLAGAPVEAGSSESAPLESVLVGPAEVDPGRVTSAVVDEATIERMSRDFTVASATSLRAVTLFALLVVLSVLVQFASDAVLRWVLPVVTVLLALAVVVGGHLATRRVLRRSAGGAITLTFAEDGFTAMSPGGLTRTDYRDIVSVTVRGATVMIRGTGGAVALYPRALFPEPLLAEVRAGAAAQ
jgi:hypothetical protein